MLYFRGVSYYMAIDKKKEFLKNIQEWKDTKTDHLLFRKYLILGEGG